MNSADLSRSTLPTAPRRVLDGFVDTLSEDPREAAAPSPLEARGRAAQGRDLGFERTTLFYVGERFAGEDYRHRSPLLVLGLFRRRGPRPWLGFEVTLVPDLEAARAPRPLLHVGAARRRGRVRPYLNLYAHPGLMYELYAGLTLGRSEA
jgi:hypothetical protein